MKKLKKIRLPKLKLNIRRLSISRSLGNKIRFGFIILLVIFLLNAGYNMAALNQIENLFNDQLIKEVEVSYVSEIVSLNRARGLSVNDFVNTNRQQALNEFYQYNDELRTYRGLLSESIAGNEELENLFRQGQILFAEFDDMLRDVIDTIVELGSTVSVSEIQRTNDKLNEIIALDLLMVDQILAEKDAAASQTADYLYEAQRNNIAIVVLAFIIALITSQVLTLILTRPIKKMVDYSNLIAEGDLTVEDIKTSNDEVGQLGSALQSMKEQLKDIITSVVDSAERINQFAQELASSSNEASASVEEVASTTNQFASSTDQINDRTQNMTEDAEIAGKQVNNSVKQVVDVVNQMDSTEEIIAELSSTMDDLGKRSNEISRIVDLISNISEQTNLLALNAAIEAARAGEYGRGFAVVADEVRELAEQSSTATVEIGQLIKSMQEDTGKAVEKTRFGSIQLKEGTTQLGDVRQSVEQVNQVINTLVDNIRNIAESTSELSNGSQQIASASQEQSATLEEIAVQTQNLEDMANGFKQVIEHFTLN